MSKPMSEQMQKVAARYEKATGKKFGQKTNADHIRAMTDEELYSVLEVLARNDVCVNSAHDDGCLTCVWYQFCGSVHCAEDVKDWLKQPYKEEV